MREGGSAGWYAPRHPMDGSAPRRWSRRTGARVALALCLGAGACSVGRSVIGGERVPVREAAVPIGGRVDVEPTALPLSQLPRFVLADCDADGDLDVADQSGRVYLQAPGGAFVPAAEPIFEPGPQRAVDLGDVDGDGVMDATLVGETIELRPGLGGCRFGAPVVTPVRPCAVGAPVMLAPVDADLDGVRDFWAVCGLPGEGPTVLLRGLGDGRFEAFSVPAMATLNGMQQGLPAFSVLAEDLDDDGAVDAALLSDTGTGWFGWGTPGAVAHYTLDEALSDTLARVNTMGIVSLDFDRDGRIDSFWSGDGGGNRLLRSLGGRDFAEVSGAAGMRDEQPSGGTQSWSAVALDADLDGWTDVLVLRVAGPLDPSGGERPARPRLFINQRDGTFTDHASAAAPTPLQGKQAVCGDLAGDGRVGCLVVEPGRVSRLENHLASTGGWLGVHLRGTVSDPEGIGAVVSVEGLDRPLVRRVGPGAATWAHHPLGLVLPALGAPARTLRVRWPSGIEQRVPDVPAGVYSTLVEPEAVRLSARVAPADGRGRVEVTVRPGAAGARSATIEARGAVAWAGPAETVDGALRRTLIAPAAPGVVTLDVTLDGAPLRVHPRVVFR